MSLVFGIYFNYSNGFYVRLVYLIPPTIRKILYVLIYQRGKKKHVLTQEIHKLTVLKNSPVAEQVIIRIM